MLRSDFARRAFSGRPNRPLIRAENLIASLPDPPDWLLDFAVHVSTRFDVGSQGRPGAAGDVARLPGHPVLPGAAYEIPARTAGEAYLAVDGEL